MADLHIPDAAIAALAEVAIPGAFDDDPRGHVADVAAPVVAAELRRLAAHLVETYSPDTPQIHSAMSSVYARANELDPPQSGGDPA